MQATTYYQTYPVRPPGADLPPKKVCNLGPMAPRSSKKRQLPDRAPGGDGDALTGAKLRSIELQLKAAALQGEFKGLEAARDLLHEAGVRALNERLAQRE